MTHVLVIDPDTARRDALHATLERAGFAVTSIADADPKVLASGQIDALLCNVALPSGPGIRLLKVLANTPLILFSEHGAVRQAVDAIKSGAADYLVHPIDGDELSAAIEVSVAAAKNAGAGGLVAARELFPAQLIGSCPAMTTLLDRIHSVAATDTPVLILGEVGTGKERVARALHAQSKRSDKPLISLNCTTVPQELIESELFGFERGATPGAARGRPGLIEAADQGTLFIEDVADMPMDAQARLLRVLRDSQTRRSGSSESRAIDVRIIAASRRDLRRAIEAGIFREDLYYRLGVVTLLVPPLRERGIDLPELSRHLLKRACTRLARSEPAISEDALDAIRDYSWPGNVRELENALERALILCRDDTITADVLGIDAIRARQSAAAVVADDATTLEDYFVRFVTEHQDELTETEIASKLGISRKSLWERRQRLNIPRRRTQKRGPRRDQ